MKKALVVFVTLFMCMSAALADMYSADETMRVQNVQIGTVEDLRYVEINERSSWSETAATGIGATLGGLAGSNFGKGSGKTAMTIVLAALGGGIGNEVEQIMNTAPGVEFIVMLNDGRTVAVTQKMDVASSQIDVGDRVRIVDGQNTRVVKLRNASAHSSQFQNMQAQRLQHSLQQQLLELRREQAVLREEQKRMGLD